MELNDELVQGSLTRKQLAERHGITSDRVAQWLCLLKLPKEKKMRILSLGDNWHRQIVTKENFGHTADYDRFLKARQTTNIKTTRIVQNLGMDFAFPSTTVYLEMLR